MSVLAGFGPRWQRLPLVVRDLPLGLVLLLASLVPALRPQGTELGELPTRPLDALAVLPLLLETLPLALRRRAPLASVTLVAAGFALDQLRAYHLVAGAALALALLSTGLHLERHRRATAAGLTGAYVVLAVALAARGSTDGPTGFVTFYLLAVVLWGAGGWLRSARAGEAERQRLAAEAAIAGERSRLARELHDVVTHHVTAMVVQAQAARYLTAAPDRLDGALETIADTGRLAVTDLRQLLHVLDPHQAPGERPGQPSVGEVPALVEQARRAGQPVELVLAVDDPTTGSIGLTAYRVVQEGLTNALKHAPGGRTLVSIEARAGVMTVEVRTTGAPASALPPTPVPTGSGRGLTGLRERVEALAGEFAAGPRADGGFLVRARLPLPNHPRSQA